MTTADLRADPLLRNVPEVEGYKVLDRCVIYAKLGEGGMGAVYRGMHLTLSLDVAIKCMKAGVAGHEAEMISRFVREARLAARISSPNLVRVFDVNEKDGLHYLVMEYVLGETARERVRRKGPLDVAEACAIMLGAARGVAAAHAAGVVHRDIKPDNILVSKSGEVKVADLGLAKGGAVGGDGFQTMTQAVMGTPRYMPPEQFESAAHVGPQADVYALGATLHFLLGASDPYPNKSFTEIIRLIHTAPFPDIRTLRQGIPDDIAELIAVATRHDIGSRFEDASVFAKGLEYQLSRLGGAPSVADPNAGEVTGRSMLVSPPPDAVLGRISVFLGSNEARAAPRPAKAARTDRIDQSMIPVTMVSKDPRALPQPKRRVGGLIAALVLLPIVGVGGWFGYRYWRDHLASPADRPGDTPGGARGQGAPRVVDDPAVTFDLGRRQVQEEATLDAGIATLEALHEASPQYPGLKPLLVQALRTQADVARSTKKWGAAIGAARRAVAFDDGTSAKDALSTIESEIRADLLERVRITEPAPGAAFSTSRVVVRGTVDDSAGIERLTVGGTDVTIISRRFEADLGQRDDGPFELAVTVVGPGGVTATTATKWTVDTADPTIDITSPVEGARTSPFVKVSGRVADAAPLELRCAESVFPAILGDFVFDVTFEAGRRQVTVTATDRAGRVVSKSVNIVVDVEPPTIVGLGDRREWYGKDSTFNIDMTLRDDGELQSATLDGKPLDIQAGGRVRARVDVTREGQWVERKLEVTDLAGNLTTERLRFMLDRTPPVLESEAGDDELPPGPYTWRVRVRDDSPCVDIRDGVERACTDHVDVAVVLDADGSAVTARVVVRDAAGNVATLERQLRSVAPCVDCSRASAKRGDCARCDGRTTIVETCPDCNGDRRRLITCSSCNGDGMQSCGRCNGQGQYPARTCDRCNGRRELACGGCNGRGTREGTCSDCSGLGRIGIGPLSITCPKCAGVGRRHYDCVDCKGKKVLLCVHCQGRGTFIDVCQVCNGRRRSGVCVTCNGQRQIAVDCLRCKAVGTIVVTCTVCRGSGQCLTCKGTGKRPR